MAYLEPLYDAIRTRIAAVWPDVPDNGIFEPEHVDLIPWADLTPPFAVVAIDAIPKGEWGSANEAFVPQVHIYYVAKVNGPLSGIRAKLEDLDADLRTAALTAGQVLSNDELNWSEQLEPNQVFIQKRMAHRAGRVSVTCLIGLIYS
jgi:hypothetical protein